MTLKIIIPKKRKSPTLTEICGVCSDRAPCHFQYGAKSVKICFACRGFFRRVVRNKNLPQTCKITLENITGKCDIEPKTRKKCSYCRFEKCCDMGMKAELVMSNEDAEDYKKRVDLCKKSGIASKLLPETTYRQRIKILKEKTEINFQSTKSGESSNQNKDHNQNDQEEVLQILHELISDEII